MTNSHSINSANLKPIRYDSLPIDTVLIGESAGEAVAKLVEEYDFQRVLIIASGTLNKTTNVIEVIGSALGKRKAGVFASVGAHTPRSDVLQLLSMARDLKVDGLVTVGGGSVIDAGKVTQLCLNNEINTEQQLISYSRSGDGRRGEHHGRDDFAVNKKRVRQIAVPTTLSGSEFSSNASVIDLKSSVKEGYYALQSCPRAIVYDPQITLHTPEWLWFSTAIRSLDHAVEGFCDKGVHPFLEGQFLHAMRLFAQSLPAAKENPGDVAARSLNQQAVWLACSGLGRVSHGASHGIGYSLGSLCGVPHGYTSCVMLPAVLQWNQLVNGDKQKLIAEALNLEKETTGSASEAVRDLVKRLGLPTTLREVGVKESQLEVIAQSAATHSVVRNNPRPIRSADEVMEILQLAW